MKIKNYILGEWVEANGIELVHYHSITGKEISSCSSEGLDYKSILNYGRDIGGLALRKMTFQQRGRMLKA